MTTRDCIKSIETMEVTNKTVMVLKFNVRSFGPSEEDISAIRLALKRMNSNALLITIPDTYDLRELPEENMAKAGWYRQDEVQTP